jgi:hypothetical protein
MKTTAVFDKKARRLLSSSVLASADADMLSLGTCLTPLLGQQCAAAPVRTPLPTEEQQRKCEVVNTADAVKAAAIYASLTECADHENVQ